MWHMRIFSVSTTRFQGDAGERGSFFALPLLMGNFISACSELVRRNLSGSVGHPFEPDPFPAPVNAHYTECKTVTHPEVVVEVFDKTV